MKNKLFFLLTYGLYSVFACTLSSCGEDEGTDYSTEAQENGEFAHEKTDAQGGAK